MERLGLLVGEKAVQGRGVVQELRHVDGNIVFILNAAYGLRASQKLTTQRGDHHAHEATPKPTKQTRSVVHLARQWPAAITGGLIAGGCSRGDPDIETRDGCCAATISSFPSSLDVSE